MKSLYSFALFVSAHPRVNIFPRTHTQEAQVDVKSKQEAVSLNALGKFMNVHTHSIRKAAGKASDEHPDNKTRLLRFVDSIVAKACALVCPNDATGFLFLCLHTQLPSSHLCSYVYSPTGLAFLKRPWPLANVSGCVMGEGKCHQAPCADSNCQLPVAGVYVQKMRPPLSKQSRGKSTLKSSRWSKILTHLEMRLPSGGHE